MVFDQAKFEERIQLNRELLSKLKNKSSRLSFIRLLSFILFITLFILGIINRNVLYSILSVFPLVLFVIAVVSHSRILKEIEFKKALICINEEYLARVNCDFNKLTDTGDEFFVNDHDYSYDLDVVGKSSIFAKFNVSDTYMGRKCFADKLHTAHVNAWDSDRVVRIQSSVRELADNYDLLENYQAIARLGNLDKSPEALINLTKMKNEIKSVDKAILNLQVGLWLIPFVMLVFIPRFVTSGVLGVMVFNLILWYTIALKYCNAFSKAEGIAKQAKCLFSLYDFLDGHEFKSEYLLSIIGKKGEKSEPLKSLSSALFMTSFRSQPLFALLLNSVVPYDYWCSVRISKWVDNNGSDINSAIINLGELESLMSAACVALVCKDTCFPQFVSGAYFEGKDIYHPLINPNVVVSNSVKLDSQTAIITGSNMSGKTTLIRTIGVCAILSYIGAPVPATSLTLGHMHIMSSMRIVDSLESNMSTFRAELVKIARIVNESKSGKDMLFLIDEIFRGTNSADRTDGAFTVLQSFAKSHISGLMTTHDYALCDKVKDEMNNIVYYHFSEKYNDNDIIFDYKLKDGISNESNAKFLMRLVGITE